MKAEKYVTEWLSKKYGEGGKELGDWTPNDVVEFATDYAALVLADVSRRSEQVCDHDPIEKGQWYECSKCGKVL